MEKRIRRKNGNGLQGQRQRRPDGTLGAPTNSFQPGIINYNGKTPRIFERKIRKLLIKGLKLGVPYQTIATSLGIRVDTLRGWLQTAERISDEYYQTLTFGPNGELILPEGTDQRVEIWVQIYMEISEAESYGELKNLAVIQDAAIGNNEKTQVKRTFDKDGKEIYNTTVTETLPPKWQAASWLLERKHPDRYGKHRIAGPGGALPEGVDYETLMLAKLLKAMPRQELERVRDIVRESLAPGLPGPDDDGVVNGELVNPN